MKKAIAKELNVCYHIFGRFNSITFFYERENFKMGKNSNQKSSFMNLICFLLFVVWGVGTVLNIVLAHFGISIQIVGVIENVLRICAVCVMAYCGYLYYAQNKENKLVFCLFWISLVVLIVVVILPFLL